MKPLTLTTLIRSTLILTGLALATAGISARADQTKANNNTALQSGGSWVSGTAPGSNDNAIWNATVSTPADCINTLGSAVTWKGIVITNPSAAVMINGSTTLTLNNGINMGSATENLTLNCGTIDVASNETWAVASGLTLTTGSATNAGSVNSGNNIVTLAGSGTWVVGGTGDNNSLGITVSGGTVNLNKASSSGVHAVGGPGMTVNSGATARLTGTGGDQIYNGASVTINGTLDLFGNNESINGLNGSGTVTTTVSNGTPVLTLGASGNGGTFSGTIEAGASGSITLTTTATNLQSVACVTRGSGTAGPNINVNAGTLSLNGSADNSFATATVAGGATLLLAKTSTSGIHAIGSTLTVNSGGLAQITGTGGDQIYDSDDITINGTLDLNGNSEAINALNGSGTVTTTLSGGTPTLTVGGAGDSGTFSGMVQAGTNGSITLTKAGSGTQSVACVTRGNGTAGPNINVNAGTLTLNGATDNGWAAATVNSGGTLLLGKTSGSSTHAIGGGGLMVNSGGTLQLTGTGGDQIYDGASVSISGTFDLDGNSETIGSLSFSGGTLQNSAAVTGTLTDAGTLAMNGNVTVNFPNAPSGTVVILQYTGTRSGSGSFVAGSLPAGATVVDNTSAQTVSVVNGGSGGSTNTFSGVGAVIPFTSLEGEAGKLGSGASVVSLTSAPTTEYSSPQLEASGHAYVQLTNTGQSVTWTNTTTQSFTAINLRSCIPDASGGGGITSTIDLYVNGVFRQALSVNSLQNYCYEGTSYNNQTDKNPADGDPRGFWNDTHAFITGAAVAPGSTITLQKDSTNSASFYYVDVIDLEAPPAPPAQPANSLSILSYGAVSNNASVDNTAAINNCFSAAQSQGKIAWIPAGTYYISAINGGLNATGITIEGAGPWYSTIYRVTPAGNTQGIANILTSVSCIISNLSLDCNATSRANDENNGAVNSSGTNWVVNNVWIQHVTSSFWCAGVNGIAENCRTLSTWADGGNFNNVQSANGVGMNLTYSNNFVRGTGDDAMAINSVNYNVNGSTTNYYTIMSNITYANNTAIAPWGGKCMGIYGGVNDVVTNNLLQDTARYLGLGVMKFGVNGSATLSATVEGNTVLRCGGNGYNQQQQAMMIGNGGDGQGTGTVANAYCASNTIIDSLYDAVGFSTSTNIVFQRNTIINPGLDAIAVGPPDLGSSVMGTAIINSNIVTGLGAGHFALTNSASDYAAIVPTQAANYSLESNVQTENCVEGGLDVGYISNGSYTAYNSMNLNGATAFVARVASGGAGGNIQVYLDNTNGTLVGTCAVPATGGWQTWTNAYCSLSGASGTHTLYLVYTGGAGNLFNVEFFGLFAAPTLPNPLVLSGPVIVSNPKPVFLQLTPNTAAGTLTLHWSGESTDAPAQVYYTSDLTPPVTWTPMSNAPAYANGQWSVTLPVGTNSSGFYRVQ